MRKLIWDSMLDADMNTRYWGCLTRRYSNRDKRMKIFLALMSSGTFASLWFWTDIELLWKILSAISTVIAISLPILNLQKSIETMATLKAKWTQIETEYEIMWSTCNKEGSDDSQTENTCRYVKKAEVEANRMEATLPNDKKLIQKCCNEVLESRGL